MRDPLYPVLIVSAFGRGHALAHELRAQDIPVLLLDVGPSLGESLAEDEEGPFGFFSQGLSLFESQRLQADAPPLLQTQGLTWMLRKGPLEMRGALASLHRESLEIPEVVWQWVQGEGPKQVKEHQYLLNADFRETWFYHLSRSFHSNHWAPNYRAGLVEGSLPFGSDFMIRSVYRAGVQRSLEQLEAAGVEVRSPVEILDAAREGNSHLKSFEIRKLDSDSTELIAFENLIWFLSGEETEKLSPRLQEKIFPQGVLRPKGVWSRSRLKFPVSAQRDVLPLHSIWVQDVDLPWTHENLFVLIRTSNPELFDLWFRLPEAFRFQRDYLQVHLQKILEKIESRMGIEGLQVTEYPNTVSRSLQEVGPARFPLFDERESHDYPAPKWRNFHWVAPETCQGLGWNFLFQKARRVQLDVREWWQRREEERKKREQKELEKVSRT